jgi:hypothetical protein
MPVPTYDELMLPLLKLAAQDGAEHPIRDLRVQLAQQIQLTPEERILKLPSGRQSVFDNRVGWACTHLRKAQLIDSPRRGYIRISPRGRKVLAENPHAINDIYLQRFDEYRQFKERTTPDERDRQNTVETAGTKQTTPDEMIRDAHAILEANLRDDLLDKIKQMDPGAFEWSAATASPGPGLRGEGSVWKLENSGPRSTAQLVSVKTTISGHRSRRRATRLAFLGLFSFGRSTFHVAILIRQGVSG